MLRRSVGRLPGVLITLFLAAGAPAARAETSAPPPSGSGPAVLSIGVVKGKAGTQVTIAGDADLGYEYFVIEGTSLVIDVPGATSRVWPAEQAVDDDFIGRVRVSEQAGDKRGVRVAFDLKRPDGFTVRGDRGQIVVSFSAPAPQAKLNLVTGVIASPAAGAFRIRVATDAPPLFRLLPSEDSRTVQLAIEQAALDPAAAGGTDYAALDAVVTRVSARAEAGDPPRVLVTLALRRPVPFLAKAEGAGVNVDFTTAGGESAAAGPSAPRPAAPAAPPVPAAVPSADPAPVPGGDGGAGRHYTGSRITLDFVDADISDIFRLIADVAAMNIVAGDDVKGRRSVKMTEVPWDQALELILKTNIPQLVQVRESDSVIRVTTLQRLLDDQTAIEKRRLEQLQRAAQEQKQALERAETVRKLEAESQSQLQAKVRADRQRSKGWLERTFTISYGDTKEVAARLEKFFSGCKDGCIFEVGERSKTIFVRDFVDNVEQMNAIITVLEAPTPAVMVEARIVEVQSDFSQALGIQWGANFVADPGHGNATRYAFPNTINVGGTAREGADGVNPGSYLVNLPASNAVAGVGFTLGHIANTLTLDMRLSALERMGKTKILSNPKVLVVQNEEANINVGSQLPVPKTDADGNRTIEWKDVGILLQVTPNITSDGRVFMKLKIEKSAAGETVRTTEGDMFSIERRGAMTKVLVGDGETSVIGGIFQQTTSGNEDGVPGLSKLPLLGWLFRSKSEANSRKELMIFLTPRIATDVRDLQRGAAGVPASPAPPSRTASGDFGTVTVLKAEQQPGNRVLAVVSYTNDTAFTYLSSVTINCKAYATDGRVIGGDIAHLWARDHGPIGPSFKTRQELPFSISGGDYAAVRCEVLGAE